MLMDVIRNIPYTHTGGARTGANKAVSLI
jgi:hypothetical protein